MEHSFDINHASKYGVKEAILIKSLQFWIMKNKANKKHGYDGRTWTYNTCTALSELFPYWTDKQVRTVIQSLKDKNVIIVGNYNSTPYDRTLWYAFKEEALFLLNTSILPNGQIEKTDVSNRKPESVTPIPDTIPDIKTDKEQDDNSLFFEVGNEERQQSNSKLIFDEFRKAYGGTKRGLDTEYDNFVKKTKDHKEVLPTLLQALTKYKQWRDDAAKLKTFVPEWKNLATWINNRCWENEHPTITNKVSTQYSQQVPLTFDSGRYEKL